MEEEPGELARDEDGQSEAKRKINIEWRKILLIKFEKGWRRGEEKRKRRGGKGRAREEPTKLKMREKDYKTQKKSRHMFHNGK